MKRIILLILVGLQILAGCAALADTPASQFGISGWPYRQGSPCGVTARPTKNPAATPRPAAPTARSTQRPTAKPTDAPSISRGDYTTTSVTMQEKKLWNLMNQDRQSQGLPALPLDAALSDIARTKSCDMNQNQYFAHTSPTYGSAAQMLTAFHYSFNGVGENIAHHANVEKAEAAFLSSSGHRTNIMGKQWTKVGIGVCFDKNGFVYVTQLFVR